MRKSVWRGSGPYKDLKLFDQNGQLVMDLDMLRSCGLVYLEYSGYQVGV